MKTPGHAKAVLHRISQLNPLHLVVKEERDHEKRNIDVPHQSQLPLPTAALLASEAEHALDHSAESACADSESE